MDTVQHHGVVFGNVFDSSSVFSLVPHYGWSKVAVLDVTTLVCYWKDYVIYLGKRTQDHSTIYIKEDGLNRISYGSLDKVSFVIPNLRIQIKSETDYTIYIRDKLYKVQLGNSSLYLNGRRILSEAKLAWAGFSLVLICDSDEGIYRLVFYVSGRRSVQEFLNLWLDIETGEVLCYSWGFGLASGVSALPVSDGGKYRRLCSRLARSAMFGLEGRLF